jgi:hypothetical protein
MPFLNGARNVTSPPLVKKIVLFLTAAAFSLRLVYLLRSHPFIDEFTTVLAARAILERGLPVLPSGLFYEHGLLFTYLDSPFVALAAEKGLFAMARLPSVLIGTVTVPFLYAVGRRWLSPMVGLVAAALLALSPEGMVWGGRARMYALAQFLVLLVAYLVYEGSREDGNRLRRCNLFGARFAPYGARWLALLVLLALLLTQFGALILVPPLLIGALAVGWLKRPNGVRPWFLRRAALAQGALLMAVVGLGVLVKRLGRPIGAAPLGDGSAGGLVEELIRTITYQAGLVLDGESAVKLLSRQFGVPHHLWLSLIAVVGGLLALGIRLSARKATDQRGSESSGQPVQTGIGKQGANPGGIGDTRRYAPYSLLFLWLIFGLTVIEMVFLIEPWRRNPRYLVMALPVFYLIVGASVEIIIGVASGNQGIRESGNQRISKSVGLTSTAAVVFFVVFVAVQAGLLVPDLRVAYLTPEPAYEEAFQYVADHWQPGDVLLTMNTSGAGLLMGLDGQASYGFAIQEDAEQFFLNTETQAVDRWLGAPWIGTVADLNLVLNEHLRAWFVVDTIRLPVYYRGDWLALLETQMDLVWSGDEALVYLTRPDRTPVPADPDVPVHARFGDAITLTGYSLAREPGINTEEVTEAGRCDGEQTVCLEPGQNLQVTLFWRALAPVDADYTAFVHLRDEQGATVAQRDSQPFGGMYPTSQWQLEEIVAQPVAVDLPPDLDVGNYSLYVGLYKLDTMTRLSLDNDMSGEDAVILDETMLVVSGDP